MYPSLKSLQRLAESCTVSDPVRTAALVRKVLTAKGLEAFLTEYCPRTLAWRQSCYHDPLVGAESRAEVRMKAADELLGTYGVEYIRGRRSWDRYWYDVVLLYCNAGDTYAPTLLYNPKTGSYRIGSWGDYAERHTVC
jgi:hypothetical protein